MAAGVHATCSEAIVSIAIVTRDIISTAHDLLRGLQFLEASAQLQARQGLLEVLHLESMAIVSIAIVSTAGQSLLEVFRRGA